MLQDVCCKNFAGIRYALTKMGHRGLAESAIECALGVGTWTDAELAKRWVSLDTYQLFENEVVKGIGHPFLLGEIGRFASEKAFGSQAIDRNIVKSGLKFLTTPRLAVKIIPEASRAYVINKLWKFVFDSPRRALLSIEYVDLDGVKRTEFQDLFSLRYYIPGLIDSIPDMWGKRVAAKYTARFRTLNLRPEDIVAKSWPTGMTAPNVQFANGILLVGGNIHGKIVHLKRDIETDQFLGNGFYTERAEPGTIPAILITESVLAPSSTTGAMLPLMEAGDVYRFELPLLNLMEVKWESHWWYRMFEFLILSAKGMNKDLSQESRTADAEQKAESVSQQLAQTEAFLARTMPTKEIAALAARKMLTPFDSEIAVLQFDIVSYTARTKGWTAAFKAQEIGGLLNTLLGVGVVRGGWDYKTIGDAGVLVFNPWWNRGIGDHNPIATIKSAARAALLAAGEIHRCARHKGYQVRIGINVGMSTWYDISTFSADGSGLRISPRLEANGDAFDLAARLEAYTEPHTTAVSHQAMVAAFGQHFTSHDTPENIMLGYRNVGDVKVKGDGLVHAWVRKYEKLDEEFVVKDNVVLLKERV